MNIHEKLFISAGDTNMARKIWSVKLEDGLHTVEIIHNNFSGEKKILIDGECVFHKEKDLFERCREYPFQIGENHCYIDIRVGLGIKYDFVVNGVSADRNQPVLSKSEREKREWLSIKQRGKIQYLWFEQFFIHGFLQAIFFSLGMSVYLYFSSQDFNIISFLQIAGISFLVWPTFFLLEGIYTWRKFENKFNILK